VSFFVKTDSDVAKKLRTSQCCQGTSVKTILVKATSVKATSAKTTTAKEPGIKNF